MARCQGAFKQGDVQLQIALDGRGFEVARVVFELQTRAFFEAVDDGEQHLENGTGRLRTERYNLDFAYLVGLHEGLLVEEENGHFEAIAVPLEK